METRKFKEDLEKSQSTALKQEWGNILKKIFGQNIKIDFRENCKITQLKFGTDVLIKKKNGRKYSVELKTKNYRYHLSDIYILEVKHHIYSDESKKNKEYSKEGWLYCSTADYLIYATLNQEENKIIEVCGFSLIPFKDEIFKKEITKLETKFASTKFQNNKFQTTVIKLAPLEFIRKNANWFIYFELKGDLNDFF